AARGAERAVGQPPCRPRLHRAGRPPMDTTRDDELDESVRPLWSNHGPRESSRARSTPQRRAHPAVARRSGPTRLAAWRDAHRTNSQRASEPRETYRAVSQSRPRPKPPTRAVLGWKSLTQLFREIFLRFGPRLSNATLTRARARARGSRQQAA